MTRTNCMPPPTGRFSASLPTVGLPFLAVPAIPTPPQFICRGRCLFLSTPGSLFAHVSLIIFFFLTCPWLPVPCWFLWHHNGQPPVGPSHTSHGASPTYVFAFSRPVARPELPFGVCARALYSSSLLGRFSRWSRGRVSRPSFFDTRLLPLRRRIRPFFLLVIVPV